jgi:hypothetical protein
MLLASANSPGLDHHAAGQRDRRNILAPCFPDARTSTKRFLFQVHGRSLAPVLSGSYFKRATNAVSATLNHALDPSPPRLGCEAVSVSCIPLHKSTQSSLDDVAVHNLEEKKHAKLPKIKLLYN